ncbi:MAG: hypothetical protein RL490_2080 [Pseudomonadota bacterium]
MGMGQVQDSTPTGLAALSWLVGAGVDVVVGDTPRNWLAAPVAAPVRAPLSSQNLPKSPVASPPRPAVSPQIAASAPISAADLPALLTTLADFAHPLRRPGAVPQLLDGAVASGIVVLCEQPEPEGSPAAVLRSRMLAAIGLSLDTSALAHRVPWPVSPDAAPRPSDIAAFAPFLARALDLHPPRLILALGQTAAALAGDDMGSPRHAANGAASAMPRCSPSAARASSSSNPSKSARPGPICRPSPPGSPPCDAPRPARPGAGRRPGARR